MSRRFKTYAPVWPDSRPVSRVDRLLEAVTFYPGFCNLCSRPTVFRVCDPNYREYTPCMRCGGVNRYRQIVLVLLQQIHGPQAGRFRSIRDIPKSLRIWNTETTRALHHKLAEQLGDSYIASEYLGPEHASGEMVNGVLNIDMQKTHFDGDSLDYVISSDVIEHIPFYLEALRETYRILKVGGAHVFTAPFYQHRFSNEHRSIMSEDGRIEHLLRPWFHLDPLQPEGVLCFNVFAPELLVEIEAIGFEAQLYIVHDPILGILGNNGVVLCARKSADPAHRRDQIFPDSPAGAPGVAP